MLIARISIVDYRIQIDFGDFIIAKSLPVKPGGFLYSIREICIELGNPR
jgi:hypothetical protein